MKPARPLSGIAVACCLLGCSQLAAAEPLGRLFFTPERRAALERQRQLNIQETQAAIEGATLTVSGIVQRSGGKNTAWINGAPVDERNAGSGVSVQIDRTTPGKTIVVAGEEAPATLKVGEAINRTTRETSSGIGEGRVAVKREGAKAK